MVLSSLIHQLPCGKYSARADGTILESSQQCGRGPKGFKLFWDSMDLFSIYLRAKEEPDCTLRLAHRGMEIHNMAISYLVENLLGWSFDSLSGVQV